MPPKGQRRSARNRARSSRRSRHLLVFFPSLFWLSRPSWVPSRSRKPGPDRTYLVVGMIVLIFFVVGVVAFLAYSGKGLLLLQWQGRGPDLASRFSLLVGPTEDMPELDITAIEWDDSECFILGSALRKQVVAPRAFGQSWVQIPRHLFATVEPDSPLELHLKDIKGHRWRVKRFYIFENLLPLSPGEDREVIMRDYEEGRDEQRG